MVCLYEMMILLSDSSYTMVHKLIITYYFSLIQSSIIQFYSLKHLQTKINSNGNKC